MQTLRKTCLQYLPYLIWALTISLGYAMVSYALYAALLEQQEITQLQCYQKGLCLIFPLVIFGYGIEKTKSLWQFVLLSVGVLLSLHFIMGCYLFTGIACILCLTYLITRIIRQLQIQDEVTPMQCVFDIPDILLLCVPVVYFFLAGTTAQVFFQKMAIYHFVWMVLLFFVLFGLRRFTEYVRLCEQRANVPSRRILDTGMQVFLASALVIFLVCIPVIHTQYAFLPISFSKNNSEAEFTYEMVQNGTDMTSSMNFVQSYGQQSTQSNISWLWEFLDQFLPYVGYAIVFFFALHWLQVAVVNFKKTKVEKNDVIESTLDFSEESKRTQLRKEKFAAFFDFSDRMKIRRRYKKEFKTYKPQPWQSPAEIEAMAKKMVPELHAQYEHARYSKE